MQALEKSHPAAFFLIVWLCLAPPLQAGPVVDHGLFGELLSRHVHNGLVDYNGFKADASILDQYLARLAAVDPETLDRSEAMAFYINLYNAWTIKLILSRYPDLNSIKDLGGLFRSPWKKDLVRLNGRIVTLDHIEHDILRPGYGDPRVHFAINCASMSCPPLAAAPYTGAQLELQLDHATQAFINDPRSNYMEGDTLHVSRIFKWFGEDFDHDAIGFLRKYARGDLKDKIEKDKDGLRVRYLDYDWTLNSLNR